MNKQALLNALFKERDVVSQDQMLAEADGNSTYDYLGGVIEGLDTAINLIKDWETN
jgi:hypothetical protein